VRIEQVLQAKGAARRRPRASAASTVRRRGASVGGQTAGNSSRHRSAKPAEPGARVEHARRRTAVRSRAGWAGVGTGGGAAAPLIVNRGGRGADR
jgi:hypothetical protein